MSTAPKLYFVRKITRALGSTTSIHVLSLSMGVTFRARLDPSLRSHPVFPGMTYRARVDRNGRGVVLTSLLSASNIAPGIECKALAAFLANPDALPNHNPLTNLGHRLLEAASAERCAVRDLLAGTDNHLLSRHLDEPHACNLLFAWQELQAFQGAVQSIMQQGFDQATSEKIVKCLPEGAPARLVTDPLLALPFIRPDDDVLARHPTVLATPEMASSMALLRYLEADSAQGHTLLQIDDLDERVLGAVSYCRSQGWVAVDDGLIQLTSNNRLQQAVRENFSRICAPFHPRFTEKEIEYAFLRLSAATPDLFTSDMTAEVIMAVNSRVLLVRHDDINAAIEFAQQFSAVTELLSNTLPSLVTYAMAGSGVYENELGVTPLPFYQINADEHAPALVVFQFNLLPVFEIYQLLSGLGKVVNLIAMVDVTLPANAAINQLSRYFPTVDVHVRQQNTLPLQRCFKQLAELETRIDQEDLGRIAVICDCPRIALQLNQLYSSVPGEVIVPKKGDLIRLSPLGFRSADDALVRIITVKPGGMLVRQSHTYRTVTVEEFAEHSWRAGFALSPAEAMGVALPPVLVFTSVNSPIGSSLVRNLKIQGVRVIEHCAYEIDSSPEPRHPGSLQRIVPVVE